MSIKKKLVKKCHFFFFCREDLQSLCLELQLEESVDDLMQQLGADAKGHISYAQFILCHKNLQLTPGQALYQVRFLKFVFILKGPLILLC